MAFHAIEKDPEYISLQTEMVRMQNWVKENKKRVLIIFEGRDSAGKGGALCGLYGLSIPGIIEW